MPLGDMADLGVSVEAFGSADSSHPHFRRDHLVSMLLQDRSSLRLVSAPYGYGKTELAREYARRLFVGKEVVWMDAASPDFLESLDARSLLPVSAVSDLPDLVVMDELPYLDEERAEVLARRIETLLYQGVEVMATVIPSNDCLRSLNLERILVRAGDLLVSKEECCGNDVNMSTKERLDAMQTWRQASKRLFGRTPLMFWEHRERAADELLGRFFDENLPVDLFRSVLCMMLLGKGSFDDLDRMGCALRPEYERMLVEDYPLLEFDLVKHSFAVPEFPLGSLRRGVEAGRGIDLLAPGGLTLPERALSVLFRRGDVRRAGDVLSVFCTDEQCVLWLREQGWSLIDRSEFRLFEKLFECCDAVTLESDRELLALRAWGSGLQGDWREAGHYARRCMRMGSDADEGEGMGAVMAYLALLAFDGGGPAIFSKGAYAPAGDVETPAGFLAAVVDLCNDVELQRALCVDDHQRFAQLESQRTDPGAEREDALRTLFTAVGWRFETDGCYRLALHLLSFVDSIELHRLVQELGCDVVVHARRSGLSCVTEAMLVRDLWNSGYFGPVGHISDKQDALLLERSSRMLKRAGAAAGYAEVRIPWEQGGAPSAPMITGRPRAVVSHSTREIPMLKVRLFGGFEVSVGERFVQDTEWRRKSRLFFITLVLHQGRDVARDDLLEQLWPGVERTHALDSFYTVWSNISGVLEEGPYLQRSGGFCRANAQYVVSDVSEFERLTRSLLIEQEDTSVLLDTYARLEALYRGGLLPSESGVESIDRQRERYKAMFVDAMVAATARALDVGNARVSLWFARKAMEVEQEREDVYHALIRAQIASGQRCSAIRTYFRCKEYLRDKLGLDPSGDTQKLYDNLIAVDPSLLKLSSASFK